MKSTLHTSKHEYIHNASNGVKNKRAEIKTGCDISCIQTLTSNRSHLIIYSFGSTVIVVFPVLGRYRIEQKNKKKNNNNTSTQITKRSRMII